jgi:hypothetical protein
MITVKTIPIATVTAVRLIRSMIAARRTGCLKTPVSEC